MRRALSLHGPGEQKRSERTPVGAHSKWRCALYYAAKGVADHFAAPPFELSPTPTSATPPAPSCTPSACAPQAQCGAAGEGGRLRYYLMNGTWAATTRGESGEGERGERGTRGLGDAVGGEVAGHDGLDLRLGESLVENGNVV